MEPEDGCYISTVPIYLLYNTHLFSRQLKHTTACLTLHGGLIWDSQNKGDSIVKLAKVFKSVEVLLSGIPQHKGVLKKSSAIKGI